MKVTNNKNILLYAILLSAIACSTKSVVNEDYSSISFSNKFDYQKNIRQSTDTLDFYNYLCGVNSIVVLTDSKFESILDDDNEFHRKYFKLMKEYLHGLGIENIALTKSEKIWIEENIPLENISYLKLTLDNTKNFISQINMTYKTCNNDDFNFSLETDYYINNQWDDFLLSNMKSLFWQRVSFNPEYSLKIKTRQTTWTTENLISYFDSSKVDNLEGIYEKYGNTSDIIDTKYKIAITKNSEGYNIIYLDGAINNSNWSEGELKGEISESAIEDFYKVNWVMADKTMKNDVYLTTEKYNILEFDFLESEYGFKTKYIKMYPGVSDKIVSTNDYVASGTGFFISEKGYVVTNHHVIKNAKNISVELESDNELVEYQAEILFDDRKNDLTVLKIKNENKELNINIPFQICEKDIPIGSSVFTLGYPMIETMGESLKLSDGIISSLSGYMSNESVYQVTVPINPGNSGGPLFDKSGNLVGIINAKYTGAENVTYAIKSKKLLKMLEEDDLCNTKTKEVKFDDLTLVDQVELLNDVVCLIKVYN